MRPLEPAHEKMLIALRRIIRAIDLYSRRLIHDHGLTGPQLIILRRLAGGSEIAIGELASSISLSHPTVTGILARLEKRGLVARKRGQRDRRQFLITITEEGRKLVAGAPPLMREHFVKRLETLPEWEQSQILSSLQRIVEMMEAQDLEAEPYVISGSATDDERLGKPARAKSD